MATPTSERRSFQTHSALLVSVIKRQAGSLWRGIIEGVMNSIDAGASQCTILLDQDSLTIRDDGKGFRSQEDVEHYFEVFGQPHDDREQKEFGAFRMGRGQLFAYGVNAWRSGTFAMDIDINTDGLDYVLRSGLPHHDGCEIRVALYKPLSHTDLRGACDNLRQAIRFPRVPVTLNNLQLQKDPTKINWDLELPEGDIRFKEYGNLVVYNQGIKVLDFTRFHLGIGGDVVTKKPILVNFARNDVMENCPTWQVIKKAIAAHVVERDTNTRDTRDREQRERAARVSANRRRRLTEADRVRLVNQARDKELTLRQFENAGVFMYHGRRVNPNVRAVFKVANGRVTLPPAGTYAGTYSGGTVARLQSYKLACVLNRGMLERFNVASGQELVAVVNRILGQWHSKRLSYVAWRDLESVLDKKCSLVSDDLLMPFERIVIRVLREKRKYLYGTGRFGPPNPEMREIMAGLGPNESWTDGRSVIALNRDTIRRLGAGPIAWQKYAALLMHEYCHLRPSTRQRHVHSAAFYKRYHDLAFNDFAVAHFTYECSRVMAAYASAENTLTDDQLAEARAAAVEARTAHTFVDDHPALMLPQEAALIPRTTAIVAEPAAEVTT